MAIDLTEAVSAAAQCLGVGVDDSVVVVCNETQRDIAFALASAAGKLAKKATVVEYPTLTRDGEEPPSFVRDAMRQSSVVFAPTTFSLSHTRARLEATGQGVRIASMPGITLEIFARAMPCDYVLLRHVGSALAEGSPSPAAAI